MPPWTLMAPRPDAEALAIDLGHEAIRAIAVATEDRMDSIHLQSALAHHPSSAVRAEVARRDFLDERAVESLLRDPDREVRRALIWSSTARNRIDREWLVRASADDCQLASDVAANIAEFNRIEPAEVLIDLARHSDPTVRAAVARERDSGRRTVRALAGDPDPDVRSAAEQTLQDW